jgi:hypothetical protein
MAGLTQHEQLQVTIVKARLAGMHPDWIAFAIACSHEQDVAVRVLNMWTSWVEKDKHGTSTLTKPKTR